MNPCANSNTKWKLPYLTNYIAQDHRSSYPMIALTETWLKPYITNAQVHIPGYEIIRCDRSTRKGGGVLLYLSDQLISSSIETFDDKMCQAIACTCEASKTLIMIAYRPPNAETHSSKNLFRFLQGYISAANDEYDVIIMGDFNLPNINWVTSEITSGSTQSSKEAAESLIDLMDSTLLSQYITVGTRKSNILDLFMTNNNLILQDIEVADTSLSDHKIIKVLLSDNPAYQPILTPKKIERNSFRCLKLEKANWTSINEELKNVDWVMLKSLCEEENEFPELFRLTLLQICLIHTPLKPENIKPYKPSGSRACRIISRKKRKLQVRLKAVQSKNGTPQCEEKIKKELALLQIKMRDTINGELENNELEAVKKVKENPKYFYTYAKQFLKRSSEIKLLLDEKDNPLRNKKDIADMLQKQYISVFSDPNNPDKKDPTFPTSNPASPMTEMDLTFSLEDVISAIDDVKPHSASGPDEIPITILKECKFHVAEPIFYIWENSFNTGTVPSYYKESLVTPTHKKGSKFLAQNYRPVSLTSHIVKIIERMLRKRLVDYLERNGLICKIQHGFRKGHSCLSELLDHIDDILTGFQDGEDSDVIYLDYAKAFDKVDHALLVQKLRKYGIHPQLISWIASFLSDRTQTVVVNGIHSFIAKIMSGVPQGTVLGPILFVLFINDIGNCVKHSTVRCFADDTRLSSKIATSGDCEKLQEDLNAVIKWSKENNMKLHEDKFEYLSHRCRPTLLEELPFYSEHFQYETASGITLYPSDQVKDLGIIVSSDLSWDIQINTMIQKAKAMTAWVFNIFKSRNTTTMMTLYKSMIRSIVDYCCPLWHPTKIGMTKKIEALQRTFTARINVCQDKDYWERLSLLNLMSLQRRRERYIIITIWKVLNGYHPNNMNIKFIDSKRNGIIAKLPPLSKICKVKHQSMYDSSFAVLGPKLWNLIPANLTTLADLQKFKIKLHDDFLSKIPDRPPVRGYVCANNNSLIDWCSDRTPLSGQNC